MGFVSYGLGPTYLSLNAVPGGEVGSRTMGQLRPKPLVVKDILIETVLRG